MSCGKRKIIVFGCGSCGINVYQDIYDNKVEYFVDNNSKMWGKEIFDCLIYDPERLINEDKEQVLIIVASQYFIEITSQLEDMGFIKNKHFIISDWSKGETFYLINKYFSKREVMYGPFKEMKYLNKSSGSALLPKLLGSYEEPIHNWIYEALNSSYDSIINIGCGEGYYAVGFAYKTTKAKIYAFDIDVLARERTQMLGNLNNVSDKIFIKKECKHKDLESCLSYNSLVICDIEGAEKYLLDPYKVDELKYVDIIVETHDHLEHGINEILIERFNTTHVFDVIDDYPRDMNRYPVLKNIKSRFKQLILEEGREINNQKWIRLKAINKSNIK